MKMLITTLLLLSSFSVSARPTDRQEAIGYRSRLINITNYYAELKCVDVSNGGYSADESVNKQATKLARNLVAEEKSVVTIEIDGANSFDSYIQVKALFDEVDNKKNELEAKFYFINTNKNIYKMELRSKTYAYNSSENGYYLYYTRLYSCINITL